ncbi:acyltransferase family-domain-containing protein [Bombardia bombarda]|uniref:Acyltransferase family-domain-containing protein n=1 Tax=Bombardia bombarda TaxID=252184 RepID=A0AA39XKE1_9PEZI|nr:acyltransferase family-domain-containing protein [Bombardia bombarda]
MNGHATSKHSLPFQESMGLLDEKSLSDVDSEAGHADLESRFTHQTRIWISRAHSCTSRLRSASCWRALFLRTGFFLLPSFVQSRFSRGDLNNNGRDRTLSPTAYLDGMRGLAALFVFFCHYLYTCFVIAQGWGYGEDNYHIMKLPFLRLLYQGPPMVCVFFVISGYALSLKPLKLMRAPRRLDALASTMSSLIFRRGLRLFLPTAISTLLIVLLLRVGLYEWTREFAYDDRYMKNVQEIHYERFPTAAEQMGDWCWQMFNFVHVWDWDIFAGSTAIDVHLWTIPVEFRSSMMLFLVLLGTARVRTAVRFVVVAVAMAFAYHSNRWEMLLFYSGMVLAEVDIIRGVHGDTLTLPTSEHDTTNFPPSTSPPAPPHTRQPTNHRHLWTALSILALYLMSQPDKGGESTPGWVFLTSLIPSWWEDQYRYWQSLGAVLLVLAVGRSPAWQRLFNTGVVQYLGRISYALYLMHGPVMHTVGYAMERRAWAITGTEGAAYNWGFVLAGVFVVPTVVWVADIFWRAVDAPVVRIARGVEGWCCRE